MFISAPVFKSLLLAYRVSGIQGIYWVLCDYLLYLAIILLVDGDCLPRTGPLSGAYTIGASFPIIQDENLLDHGCPLNLMVLPW